ncbi:tumor necrosis factor receptor superfamily member 21 isoform X2 [Alosa alosa]|uniref:tumor necrosis factor receptor superfamily member 21 isoform X2 n=1 Tax=Alosa alosa TaxID=278164 RepID=UPI002015280E|nr:tumor necrosis factor receptor superfamily member 21 isoform X2 [Alosa alosa]
MEWMYSTNVLIIIFLCKLLSVSGHCPCEPGQEHCKCLQCKKDYYRRQRHSRYSCDACTQPCSAKHLVEIKACSINTNRVCHCAKGYYCPEPQNFSCVFDCKPCPPGTFSNKTSLDPSCHPHTDCKGRGVITEGTATQDRVCVDATTPLSSTTSRSTSGGDATTTRLTSTHGRPTTSKSTSGGDATTTKLISTYDSLTTSKSASGGDSTTNRQVLTGPTNSSVAYDTLKTGRTHGLIKTDSMTGFSDTLTDSPSQWLVVLMILLVVSVLVGCFLWLKGKALKKQLKWTKGLPFGKYPVTKKVGYNVCAPSLQQEQQQQLGPDMESDPCVERLIPLSWGSGGPPKETGSAAQPHPGSTQHVTMNNSGRGESISNTVGSIFIYSPGMVVLGTNASDRREEGQQASVPQQESRSASSSGSSNGFSRSYPDSVGFSTQEEDDNKELSYPIPASGK